jgi:hypothetical protein
MTSANEGTSERKPSRRLASFFKRHERDVTLSLSSERRTELETEYGTLVRRKSPPELQRPESGGGGTSVEGAARSDRSIAAPFERD